MKYNIKTGKFEEIKVVETKIEIDPRQAFIDLVSQHYNVENYQSHVGTIGTSKYTAWKVLPLGFPAANSDWSMAVAKALVEFCETYKGTFICGPGYLPKDTDLNVFTFGIVLNYK